MLLNFSTRPFRLAYLITLKLRVKIHHLDNQVEFVREHVYGGILAHYQAL